MSEIRIFQIELNEIELMIITTALSSSQPINKELEGEQYRLYLKLLLKLKEK